MFLEINSIYTKDNIVSPQNQIILIYYSMNFHTTKLPILKVWSFTETLL